VKRYWVLEFKSTDADPVMLILAHATSFHKELLEPFLEGLYAHAAVSSATRSSLVKIRDAWAIDCPNHGESAVKGAKGAITGAADTLTLQCTGREQFKAYILGNSEWFNARTTMGLGMTRVLHTSQSSLRYLGIWQPPATD
jgi:hypothetical protein